MRLGQQLALYFVFHQRFEIMSEETCPLGPTDFYGEHFYKRFPPSRLCEYSETISQLAHGIPKLKEFPAEMSSRVESIEQQRV